MVAFEVFRNNERLCVAGVVEAPRGDAAASEYRDDRVKDLEDRKAYVGRSARELGWRIQES